MRRVKMPRLISTGQVFGRDDKGLSVRKSLKWAFRIVLLSAISVASISLIACTRSWSRPNEKVAELMDRLSQNYAENGFVYQKTYPLPPDFKPLPGFKPEGIEGDVFGAESKRTILFGSLGYEHQIRSSESPAGIWSIQSINLWRRKGRGESYELSPELNFGVTTKQELRRLFGRPSWKSRSEKDPHRSTMVYYFVMGKARRTSSLFLTFQDDRLVAMKILSVANPEVEPQSNYVPLGARTLFQYIVWLLSLFAIIYPLCWFLISTARRRSLLWAYIIGPAVLLFCYTIAELWSKAMEDLSSVLSISEPEPQGFIVGLLILSYALFLFLVWPHKRIRNHILFKIFGYIPLVCVGLMALIGIIVGITSLVEAFLKLIGLI